MTRKARDHNKHVILGSLPGTRKDIQIATGLSKTTVQGWITRLHKDRVIRISKWVKPTPESMPTAFYRLGSAPDAICRLEPLTNTQKQRRYRRRMRVDADGSWETFLAKANARRWAKKAKTGRHDPLMAAFYGPATYQQEP